MLTVPLTPETRGLIGRAELARMKPTAILVNVARGAVVDTDALTEALAAPAHLRRRAGRDRPGAAAARPPAVAARQRHHHAAPGQRHRADAAAHGGDVGRELVGGAGGADHSLPACGLATETIRRANPQAGRGRVPHMEDKEREATAYHEAGHAVMVPARGRPVASVSIVPDQQYLGLCAFGKAVFRPSEDWIDAKPSSPWPAWAAEMLRLARPTPGTRPPRTCATSRG